MSAPLDTTGLHIALHEMKLRVGKAAGQDAEAAPVASGKAPSRKAKHPVKAKQTARPAAKAVPSRIDALALRLGLTAFERDVILLAALPALDNAGADLIALAQGDARRQVPTIAFALSLLPGGHWSAFATHGPLRRYDLITLTDEPVASARSLLLPERVLHHLLGLDALDESLNGTAIAMAPPDVAPQTAFISKIAEMLAPGPREQVKPLLQLIGSAREIAAEMAAAAAARHGYRAYLIDAETLPTQPAERARLIRLWSRECHLTDTLPIVDAHDAATPQDLRAVGRFAAGILGPVVLLANDAVPLAHRACERIDVPRSSVEDQTQLWRVHLGADLAKRLNGQIANLASHFTATPDIIAQAAQAARRLATTQDNAVSAKVKEAKAKIPSASPEDDHEAIANLLWEETRNRTRPKLEELAQRIDARAGWDDLILPVRHRDMLRGLAAQVRQRTLVYETWGFGGANGRGMGISALFAGPSGTGKTLAAEVIAAELKLDIYRIDLSNVVSKWVGETEKNLKRVFDAAEDTSAILLFDESEALFGKRSEVRESHDRYANIEVSYLLQRMETYRGLAILTTNLRSHLDQAFLRRLRCIIEFPMPSDQERCAIWPLAFPNPSICEGLDFKRLAQLNITGGSIKNIALNAAFLAAEAGTPIRMTHAHAAARSEYAKLNKTLTDIETRGWDV